MRLDTAYFTEKKKKKKIILRLLLKLLFISLNILFISHEQYTRHWNKNNNNNNNKKAKNTPSKQSLNLVLFREFVYVHITMFEFNLFYKLRLQLE